MWIILIIFCLLISEFIRTYLPFGKLPAGARENRIQHLTNFQDGQLKNEHFTPVKPADVSYFKMISKFFFGKHPGRIPVDSIPTMLPEFNGAGVTWFGHSSYLVEIDSVSILVDPVFKDKPSPFSILGTSPFKGTDVFDVEMLPEIDIVLLTHDHYDHLSYRTIRKLAAQNPVFVCALGVGSHLEKWGIKSQYIHELAWHEHIEIKNITFTATPARHFSGRKFKRNQTVWAGFVLQAAKSSLYLGGDSGYDTHFAAIGEKYGPFDLVVLECGQYNDMWPLIHMMPEEMITAAKDLKAKAVLPVHWAKFSLAMHPWKEPINRAWVAAIKQDVLLITPMIGETITLGSVYPYKKWWEEIN